MTTQPVSSLFHTSHDYNPQKCIADRDIIVLKVNGSFLSLSASLVRLVPPCLDAVLASGLHTKTEVYINNL